MSFYIHNSLISTLYFQLGGGPTMKVEVSCLIGGMDIKEIVYVDKFEDAEKAAKSRNEFCRQISRKVLME